MYDRSSFSSSAQVAFAWSVEGWGRDEVGEEDDDAKVDLHRDVICSSVCTQLMVVSEMRHVIMILVDAILQCHQAQCSVIQIAFTSRSRDQNVQTHTELCMDLFFAGRSTQHICKPVYNATAPVLFSRSNTHKVINQSGKP